ncbi:MAG: methyltransferase domain-containing protein [Thermodesulfobacteria bacterium]|nr:methyltransferase domain-containing protein [Thermodesulfobacteriota bacterium]
MQQEILDYFSSFVKKFAGIVYDKDRYPILNRKLRELAVNLDYKGVEDLYREVKKGTNKQLLIQVVDALTTNETYFFRDRHPFEALKNHIFPELFKKREREKRIDIWSAACSTGQEPYSIAMLLLEHFADYLKRYKVSIYATDISIKSVEKAKKGLYHQIEINRGLPATYLVKYFKQEGFYWKISEEVKKLVKFDIVNLMEIKRKVFQRFDIIMCRYVLIYFDMTTKKKVFQDLWDRLKPGGYLFLGATEVAPTTFPDMERKKIGATTCYYKKDK